MESGHSVHYVIATSVHDSPLNERRVCVGCLEDYADLKSSIGYCLACGYEHDRSVDLQKMTFGVRNTTEDEWWGPTIDDVDWQDLDGFYIAHNNYQNDSPLRDAYMLERWENTRAPLESGDVSL